MNKRFIIKIQGIFQSDEFKNLLTDKISRFNLEQKDPTHINITGEVDSPKEDMLVVTIEGEEHDLMVIEDLCKRGPVFSRLERVTCDETKYVGNMKGFKRKGIKTESARPEKKFFHKRRR